MGLLDKWKGLPFAVKCYMCGLLFLGLIPLVLSLTYPLNHVSATINSAVNGELPEITYEQYAHLNETPEEKVMSAIAPVLQPTVEAPPIKEPNIHPVPQPLGPLSSTTTNPVTQSKTDWVQIIGGVNSAAISWFIFFDNRKRKRRREEEEDKENE